MERSLPTNGKAAQKLLVSFLCSKTTHPVLKNHVMACRIWSLRGEEYRPPLDTNSSAETEQQDPRSRTVLSSFPHTNMAFLQGTSSQTQNYCSLTPGSWKWANHNQVSLVYLNLIILQPSTGQFLCQMHRVHTKYSKEIGSSASLAEGGQCLACPQCGNCELPWQKCLPHRLYRPVMHKCT